MGLELRPAIPQAVSAAPVGEPPVEIESAPRRQMPWKRMLKWTILFVALIFLGDAAASLLVRPQRVRQRLNARLEAAFGRPVSVDGYSFSLWGGPTLEADGVLVGEDPRFGHEYFLRADSLAVRLRWLSLLRGRFELEALSLNGPTLNVVIDAGGDWNLAEWLGHPPAPAANIVGPMRVPFVPHFRKIEVSDGRINFKRGDEKLPFAFIGVAGTISTDGLRHWRLDLNATPWRAAELLQQAGTIHLAGNVGGTSSALRPAVLQIGWSDASISDFLRLLTGEDPGIRGTLGIALNAQAGADGWAIQGHANLERLHRWDFTQRQNDPSLSVAAHMTLDLPASALYFSDASIEAPRSNIRGSGKISWSGAATSQVPTASSAKGRKPRESNSTPSPVAFEINSAKIDFGDALSWLRSFRPNIPNGVTVSGFASAEGSISGWPLRVSNLALETTGAELTGVELRSPVRLGQARVQYEGGILEMLPATVTLGPRAGAPRGIFHIELPPPPKRGAKMAAFAAPSGIHLSGNAANAADVIGITNAFGWDVARGWQIAGLFHCDLRWPQIEWPWDARPVGSVSLGGPGYDGGSLHAPFLNLPVIGLDVRMDWKLSAEHVTIASAQAFGAHWNGTLDRSDASQWQFALSADQLTTDELDRWLNPRWRESLLDRVLPFLNSSAPSMAVPGGLRGSGTLRVGALSAAPFELQGLSGQLVINGRTIDFDNASAQVFGGKVIGSLHASLLASPGYDVHASFSDVDVAALTSGSRSSAHVFGGSASGKTYFAMKGTSRSDFASSLTCKGNLDVRAAAWNGIALLESLQAASVRAGDSSFDDAAGQFTCANGAVELSDVGLTNARTEIVASGSIDFAKRLDLELVAVPLGVGASLPSNGGSYGKNPVRLTGTISSPEFSKVASGPAPR